MIDRVNLESPGGIVDEVLLLVFGSFRRAM
jgi:hypothetical protein